MKPLARICPESDTLYVVKFQEFELYARRDVRIVATVFTPSDGPQDQVIGGLVSYLFPIYHISHKLSILV